ncbi:MAG: hypothetical protein ACRDOE_00520 [Streptosporangiaceae bacterium]
MALPDHQLPELTTCGIALATRVVGGVVVSHPCGFDTFRPMGERCAGWRPADVDQWISDRLAVKAPL